MSLYAAPPAAGRLPPAATNRCSLLALAALPEFRSFCMPVVEELKRIVEKLTGIGRPQQRELARLARPRVPQLFRFRDDGETPNSGLPLVVYRGALRLDEAFDPAAVFEETFARHGWRKSWRDGIYDFLHFHSATHEVLGFARGTVTIEFGGRRGRTLTLHAGDVAVLPAGIGHRRVTASDDLLVVGAYPAGGHYDEPRPEEIDYTDALAAIAKVKPPRQDPVYGASGPLIELWRKPVSVRRRRANGGRRAKARSARRSRARRA
jgi:uncharacterized protein YjlB